MGRERRDKGPQPPLAGQRFVATMARLVWGRRKSDLGFGLSKTCLGQTGLGFGLGRSDLGPMGLGQTGLGVVVNPMTAKTLPAHMVSAVSSSAHNVRCGVADTDGSVRFGRKCAG